ncbi:enoyl-CoA hydratase/isomerase family protein [Natrononativus amylolyticus]|uniref:enoyl-CoA hydratase/isomerase family protein n=1 Tax=Natrononativus amylolyticus TaxID=2963434 RepID=UPI0020CDC137|nr:enoyl-CoA hydratase/isomerase family protein [Natrononativus amylolyticus]
MSDDTYDKVSVEYSEDHSICYIRIDNMAENNVLNHEVILEINDALRSADRDENVDGIILGSIGDIFCSGADLSDIKGKSLESGTRWLNAYYDNLEVLKDTGKPTVAAVTGPCVAGGQELIMGCDLIVAGQSSKFGQPEVKVGSTAGSGGLQMLPLMIGERRAREILLTGRLIDAEEAYEIGLINRLVDDDDVEDEATELLLDVIENSSPQAYRVMKSIMKQWSNVAMLGWESQRELTAAVWRSQEFTERSDSFMNGEEMEKRSFMGSLPDRED